MWVCPWWRHQMKTFSALLTNCAGNSPVTGEFPAQRPVTRSSDVFFDLRLNKRLSKQSRGWWFETPSRSLWRHSNARWHWVIVVHAKSFTLCSANGSLDPCMFNSVVNTSIEKKNARINELYGGTGINMINRCQESIHIKWYPVALIKKKIIGDICFSSDLQWFINENALLRINKRKRKIDIKYIKIFILSWITHRCRSAIWTFW